MKKNMTFADRIIRTIIAVVFATLYFAGIVPGMLGIVLFVVAVVFLLTSFLNFCPIYRLLGVKKWESKGRPTEYQMPGAAGNKRSN